MTIDSMVNIKNATISFVSNGTEYRSVVTNSTFQSSLLSRYLDDPSENSHIIIRDTFLDLLDTKLRLYNLSHVDSFRFTYKDGEGYKHIIER